MTLRSLIRIALALTTVLFSGCDREDARERTAPTILPVSVVSVCRQNSFSYPVTYYGRVQPARRSELSFELAGRLEAVLTDEGKSVEAGHVLARLDTSLLEAEKQVLLAQRSSENALLDRLRRGEREEVIAGAQAEVKRLEVELDQALAEKERADKVYEGRSISKADYDKAVYGYRAAVYSLEQAKRRLEELESGTRQEDIEAQANRVAMIDAELELLNVRFEKSSIVAPFDGICVRRFQDEGVTLQPGQPVIEINEKNQLEARFSIPPNHVDAISQAKQLTVGPVRFPIREVRKVSQIDETTRSVDLVIPLANENNAERTVYPGQSCELLLSQQVDASCIKLPLSSLVASVRGLWSCYLLANPSQSNGDGTTYEVEKHDVNVLHIDGRNAFVSSTFPDQSLVVRDGTHRMVPGMRVRIAGDEDDATTAP